MVPSRVSAIERYSQFGLKKMKFKIQNFGPITDGLSGDEGFIRIAGVTVFIGGQGTGKSFVAKSLSTMMWLEKRF
jgi:predicted ATPase